jgi:hypothetical protein
LNQAIPQSFCVVLVSQKLRLVRERRFTESCTATYQKNSHRQGRPNHDIAFVQLPLKGMLIEGSNFASIRS